MASPEFLANMLFYKLNLGTYRVLTSVTLPHYPPTTLILTLYLVLGLRPSITPRPVPLLMRLNI